ncbi:hypothetical protein INF26_03775 [Olsenella sp. DSM 107455]|uniref:Uncharacterized protein n=1 Tax=Thermophilibacter gallinarum TaxID=2779357 RepID=A0ABR9QSA7_9ACTN|nr:hypothetical protein [Thermophilibacter gallinarum]MBE5023969.1 hypothetical protein [Thermophilibacter gallinarum]
MSNITRRSLVAAVGLGALGLVGCSEQDGQTTGDQGKNEPGAPSVEVTESGFSSPHMGFATAWAVARNTSDAYAVEMPQIEITAFDSDDAVIGSDTQPLTLHTNLTAVPGQTFAVASIFDVGEGSIARIEARAIAPEEGDFFEWEGDVPTFEVTSTSETSDEVLGVSASGMVSNGFSNAADVQVVAILRDGDGNGVDAAFGWSDGVAAGGSGSFEVHFTQAADFATADYYALAEYQE